MADQQKLVDAELENFRTIQGEIQELAGKQQQYAQQANENGMVKKELDLLNANSKVYKMVGPVLLKQDVEDAKSNVEKRLEFIKNESDKVGKALERKEAQAQEIRQKVSAIQSAMQEAAVKAAKSVVATGN